MPQNQKILHIAGWESLSLLFPARLEICEHNFSDRASYRAWLIDEGFGKKFSDTRAHSHTSSPFVWFGQGRGQDEIDYFLGGHDDTIAWCRQFLSPTEDKSRRFKECKMLDDGEAGSGRTEEQGYDYDLVVIGGGSGGMAAAKEAAKYGAKVACLDFVTPSPAGTSWGLGGTCVNVGCIPKKLYHAGSLLREAMQWDTSAFGMKLEPEADGQPLADVHWAQIRENIQNYIRSLNFKYRVNLREKEVTYLNKRAQFLDKHTIEATDKKGKVSRITASRFLIAVGGRPSPLPCERGDLAISSDDVFFLEDDPGKTLCVGASYISLECAGFLRGLGKEVTVAVRSILLRGFDRECAGRIGKHMEDHGVEFKYGVTPAKLEKVESDMIKVTFSDGSQDTFKTVLCAVGRRADTDKLGLENVGIETNPKNMRIRGVSEQTSCSNIYAVGDVLDNTPELTPVAIQAGQKLARRLYGGSNEAMDYNEICTTVFTPIEYSCVGLSEEDAVEKLGQDNIEVYHSEFQPLEWTLSPKRGHSSAFTKVIVDKTDKDLVLGIHYVGPNAGEVMQGYGVAMKQGLDFKTLVDTVGIHPTCSEEIVSLGITKSSGEDAAAGGC